MSKFKVGDKVIPINFKLKKEVCTIAVSREHGLFDEDGNYSHSTFTYYLLEWNREFDFSKFNLRLATQKEIDKGVRCD